MRIQDMFAKGIDRPINGVVKVNQDELDILVQELDEYVITRELKKHIITFFNNYLEAFQTPTADIGVWISGFFGSGKFDLGSHFYFKFVFWFWLAFPFADFSRTKFLMALSV